MVVFFHKVSPMIGLIFLKKGNLTLTYVGSYKILKWIVKVYFDIEFSTQLATVHPVFHILLLKKCVGYPTSIVPLERVIVKDSFTYREVTIQILIIRF